MAQNERADDSVHRNWQQITDPTGSDKTYENTNVYGSAHAHLGDIITHYYLSSDNAVKDKDGASVKG